MRINIAKYTGKAFDDVFYDIIEHRHTHYWLKGGRGSLKSSFISVVIPALLMLNPECHAVVFRKVERDIKRSVFPQIQWGIETLGLADRFRAIRSPHEITYKPTGQKIYFFGVDDPTKAKSIKPPFGYIGIVWFEELDQFAGMEELRSLNQSLLRGGSRYWVFSSFNPPKSQNNWVNEEQIAEDADRLVCHTTYLDAPRGWLGEQFILEAEKLKAKNETAYRHEYLGEVTGTDGAVFENVEDLRMSDAMIAEFDRIYDGLDFGFSLDPLAYVKLHYDAKKEEIYIFDEIYQLGLRNFQAAQLIEPKLEGRRLAADAAEPKSIADFRSYGIHAYPAKKGKDSVDFGMKWLQDRAKIYIDKRRAPNAYREFVSYEYQRNREGQFVSAYPDADNHAIDAVRYALGEVMRRRGLSGGLRKEDLGL